MRNYELTYIIKMVVNSHFKPLRPYEPHVWRTMAWMGRLTHVSGHYSNHFALADLVIGGCGLDGLLIQYDSCSTIKLDSDEANDPGVRS